MTLEPGTLMPWPGEVWPNGVPPAPEPNPVVRLYGPGPEGARCKTCRHLYCREFANRYWKCPYHGDTRGPGTDHRVNWNACAKYEERA